MAGYWPSSFLNKLGQLVKDLLFGRFLLQNKFTNSSSTFLFSFSLRPSIPLFSDSIDRKRQKTFRFSRKIYFFFVQITNKKLFEPASVKSQFLREQRGIPSGQEIAPS